jgi:transcriptional regulator GlxA family with amidase domain
MTAPLLRLGVLALDGCLLSSLGGPIDALRIAERIAQLRQPSPDPRFVSYILNARGQDEVATASGVNITGLCRETPEIDVLLVPGVMGEHPRGLYDADRLQPEIEYLRAMRARGVRIAASCSGTILLARTGLLDGRRATTSWWLGAQFRQHFPKVRLDIDQILVEDDGVITTGAATAVLNLVVDLIGAAAGRDLATQVARMLVIDSERQSQAPYVSLALVEKPRTSLAEKAERVLRKSLDQDLSVALLAEQCGTSERNLLRHFKAHYGCSPLEHIQRLRVERAKALLETTHLGFDEVVERCGYRDASSFRKLFKRATSLTPNDYRERFRLRARH